MESRNGNDSRDNSQSGIDASSKRQDQHPQGTDEQHATPKKRRKVNQGKCPRRKLSLTLAILYLMELSWVTSLSRQSGARKLMTMFSRSILACVYCRRSVSDQEASGRALQQPLSLQFRHGPLNTCHCCGYRMWLLFSDYACQAIAIDERDP
jgi:hypothetical protein